MTPKQERFVKEYLVDLCATQAAIRAGYAPKTANRVGPDLLKKPAVADAVAAAKAKVVGTLDLKVEGILAELAHIAFFDLSRVVAIKTTTVKGRRVQRLVLSNTKDLTEGERRALAEICEGQFGIKIKAHDKLKALELLGKYLGMFVERVEHSGDLNVSNNLSDEELEAIAAGRGPGASAPAPGA